MSRKNIATFGDAFKLKLIERISKIENPLVGVSIGTTETLVYRRSPRAQDPFCFRPAKSTSKTVHGSVRITKEWTSHKSTCPLESVLSLFARIRPTQINAQASLEQHPPPKKNIQRLTEDALRIHNLARRDERSTWDTSSLLRCSSK